MWLWAQLIYFCCLFNSVTGDGASWGVKNVSRPEWVTLSAEIRRKGRLGVSGH